VDFRILGPLDVRQGGTALKLGGPRQRAVLALLLLDRGRVVSGDRLIDQLWGEDVPHTARTTLQVYVSRLRKLLGDEAIATASTGYLLEVDAADLDVARFERLRDAGVHALADGRPAEAAHLLEEALAQWRGPALADFAFEDFAQAESARLEELRLTTAEELAEAELALGRQRELVPKLEALVAAQPLRERVRAQLMLALYRTGRQADALEAYQLARAALRDELGLEPSEPLRRLQRAILEHDPALDALDASLAAAPTLPAERKLVTVLFADFELPADDGDPERTGRRLAALRARVVDEFAAVGGTVQHGIADAVLGTFGAPQAQEDHAERALHASLGLRLLVPAYRAGVESGEVLVGADGAVVTGGPVTAAARIVRSAGPGEIAVGPRARAAARGAFEFESREGKPPLLLRALALSRPRGVAVLGRTFVGRTAELELLEGVFRRVVADQRVRLLSVLGEAGVGKTTLVEQLLARLGDDPAPLALQGRCLAYGRGITYKPLADILRAHLGLPTDAPPDATLRAISGREILGLTLGLDTGGGLHPVTARDRLHDAWVELGCELVADRPAVFVLEDLHWAEPPLLDLLYRLRRDVEGPLLLVGTARPPLHFEADDFVHLDPLTDSEVAGMLEALLHCTLETVLRLVAPRAEGNPLFVEELLASLIERGVLSRDGGGWALSDAPDELPAPESVQALLASRIDLLAPEAKEALQAASVAGRVFSAAALAELTTGSEPDLRTLGDRGFVYSRPDGEWAFKHALTREVAYGSLTKRRRARFHAAFADWLERERGGDESAPLIAHHLYEALRPEDADIAWADDEDVAERLRVRARDRLRRAAELAERRYAMQEAAALYENALTLEGDPIRRAELLHSIAGAHWLRYDSEAYRAAMERALALEPPRKLAAELYAELAFNGAGRVSVWRELPSADLIATWTRRAFELAEPGTTGYARALLASVNADPHSGRSAADEALAILERTEDPMLIVRACEAQATVASAARRFDDACAWCDRQLELAPQLADPDARSSQYWHAKRRRSRNCTMRWQRR
jgi:DNA-binding SARP family transcriptional activator